MIRTTTHTRLTANSHLIVAVPELLEALKEMCQTVHDALKLANKTARSVKNPATFQILLREAAARSLVDRIEKKFCNQKGHTL